MSTMPINKPGTYTAKLIDWAVTQTKDGSPQLACMFEYEQDGKSLRLTWFGSFKDKAFERTVETLRFLGFSGNDFSVLADGCEGKGLTLHKQAQIVVEIRADLNGIPRAGIAWVNDPEKATFTKKLDRAAASRAFESISMKLSMKADAQSAPSIAETEQDLPW